MTTDVIAKLHALNGHIVVIAFWRNDNVIII